MDPCPLTMKYISGIKGSTVLLASYYVDDKQSIDSLTDRCRHSDPSVASQRLRAFYAIEVMLLCSYRAFHRIASVLGADELAERFDDLMKPMSRSWSGLTVRLQVLTEVLNSVVLELTEMQLMAEKTAIGPMVKGHLDKMKMTIGWTQKAIEFLRPRLRGDRVNLQYIGGLMAQACMKEGFMFHELYDHGLRLTNTDTTYPASLWNQTQESQESPST